MCLEKNKFEIINLLAKIVVQGAEAICFQHQQKLFHSLIKIQPYNIKANDFECFPWLLMSQKLACINNLHIGRIFKETSQH